LFFFSVERLVCFGFLGLGSFPTNSQIHKAYLQSLSTASQPRHRCCTHVHTDGFLFRGGRASERRIVFVVSRRRAAGLKKCWAATMSPQELKEKEKRRKATSPRLALSLLRVKYLSCLRTPNKQHAAIALHNRPSQSRGPQDRLLG
jgi:hypothetical protein